MFKYKTKVGFHEDFAKQSIQEKYWGFLSKYKANAIGNKATQSSIAIIESEVELTWDGLAEILGEDLPLLSLERLE